MSERQSSDVEFVAARFDAQNLADKLQLRLPNVQIEVVETEGLNGTEITIVIPDEIMVTYGASNARELLGILEKIQVDDKQLAKNELGDSSENGENE